MTQFNKLVDYYRNYRPYSNQQYMQDGIALIDARINTQGNPKNTDKDVNRSYGAKWSGLSRNRRAGFVIGITYYIAHREGLDLTLTLGLKLIKGLFGRSINTVDARKAFSTQGRDASNVSADFDRLEDLILQYKDWALEKERQFKYRLLCNRDLAYEIYQKQVEAQNAQKRDSAKIARSNTKHSKIA